VTLLKRHKKNTVVIGLTDLPKPTEQEIVHNDASYNIVATISAEQINQFADIQKRYGVESVIIAFDQSVEEQLIFSIINMVYPFKVEISFVPRIYDMLVGAARISQVTDSPLVTITDLRIGPVRRKIKRGTDILVSMMCLVLLFPLFLLCALMVACSSKGGVIYRQERIGLWGRPFQILKFRTMVVDSESTQPKLSYPNDPRITKVGYWLRKYRLDELPQFWNVLKGEMSLVGPRPERQYFIEQIQQKAPYYCLIYKLRPGLTSWGPIKVGYADSVDKMVERLKYDIVYMENMSLLLDLRIIFHTFRVILDGKGQ